MMDGFPQRLRELIEREGVDQVDFATSINRERKAVIGWLLGLRDGIIHCSECSYHDPERELYGRGWCKTNVRYTRDDDFCAWAEKS